MDCVLPFVVLLSVESVTCKWLDQKVLPSTSIEHSIVSPSPSYSLSRPKAHFTQLQLYRLYQYQYLTLSVSLFIFSLQIVNFSSNVPLFLFPLQAKSPLRTVALSTGSGKVIIKITDSIGLFNHLSH